MHEVKIDWIRGHDGDLENERRDALANFAAGKLDLTADA